MQLNWTFVVVVTMAALMCTNTVYSIAVCDRDNLLCADHINSTDNKPKGTGSNLCNIFAHAALCNDCDIRDPQQMDCDTNTKIRARYNREIQDQSYELCEKLKVVLRCTTVWEPAWATPCLDSYARMTAKFYYDKFQRYMSLCSGDPPNSAPRDMPDSAVSSQAVSLLAVCLTAVAAVVILNRE